MATARTTPNQQTQVAQSGVAKKRDTTGPLTAFRAAEMINNSRASQVKRIAKLTADLEAAKRDGAKREQQILGRVPEAERGQVQALLGALREKSGSAKSE